MQIISELEGTTRGPYAGCVGYFSFNGNCDTAITIRTALVKDVFVAGRRLVEDHRHIHEDHIARQFRAALRRLDT